MAWTWAPKRISWVHENVVKALPPDISPPMVMRLAPSSIPVAMIQISSDNMTPAELYNLAYMRIRPLLVTVPGSCCRTRTEVRICR